MSKKKLISDVINNDVLFQNEEFKDIVINGMILNYKISNMGRVISFHKSPNGKEMKLFRNDKVGYRYVCLSHNNRDYWQLVHRLVAKAFIPIPQKYLDEGYTVDMLEVNHIDGSYEGKSNNTIYNLEWNTSSDNKYHAYRNNLKKSCEECPVAKYSNKQIHEVCKLLEDNEKGNREIWKLTGVSVTTIQAILSKKQWKDISCNYDFSNHKKRSVSYPKEIKEEACYLLSTTKLSFKDIGDMIGMTRNAVWALNKKFNIRE